MGILCCFHTHVCKYVCRHKPIVYRMKLAPQPSNSCFNSTCKTSREPRVVDHIICHPFSTVMQYVTQFSWIEIFAEGPSNHKHEVPHRQQPIEYLCAFVWMWSAVSLTMTLFSCVYRSVTMNGMMFALTTSCTISCVLSAMKAKAQHASVLISRSGCWTR